VVHDSNGLDGFAHSHFVAQQNAAVALDAEEDASFLELVETGLHTFGELIQNLIFPHLALQMVVKVLSKPKLFVSEAKRHRILLKIVHKLRNVKNLNFVLNAGLAYSENQLFLGCLG